MSRIAKKPVVIPAGVEVKIVGSDIEVKGPKGVVRNHMPVDRVIITQEQGQVTFAPREGYSDADALAGTSRAIFNNMVEGAAKGFTCKLLLVGVGYKAQAQGKVLNLALGFSHPVNYAVPEGIVIETPSQTEILIKGADRRLVGQVAADIRSYRGPEPYKGKGIRYDGEVIKMKEGKKK